MMRAAALIALLLAVPAWAGEVPARLPDPWTTPGASVPWVTQANIQQTICDAGWRRRERPPYALTKRVKQAMVAQMVGGRAAENRPEFYRFSAQFQLDHLIPIALGGAPLAQSNLWLQPLFGEWNARDKDLLEVHLARMVCDGKITLAEAQNAIAHNWIEAYRRYVPSGAVGFEVPVDE